MRLHADATAKREHDSNVLEIGRELLERVSFKRENGRDNYALARLATACLKDATSAPTAAKIVQNLLAAIAARKTYAYRNDDLLEALLRVQPRATLDALFVASSGDHEENLEFFERSSHRKNIADSIPFPELLAWCDDSPESRYPIAAHLVTFARQSAQNEPLVWSEEAKALFKNAPEPRAVLTAFINRFEPRSWTGSRASIMETYVKLLEQLDGLISSDDLAFSRQEQTRLLAAAQAERRYEQDRERNRNERFE